MESDGQKREQFFFLIIITFSSAMLRVNVSELSCTAASTAVGTIVFFCFNMHSPYLFPTCSSSHSANFYQIQLFIVAAGEEKIVMRMHGIHEHVMHVRLLVRQSFFLVFFVRCKCKRKMILICVSCRINVSGTRCTRCLAAFVFSCIICGE